MDKKSLHNWCHDPIVSSKIGNWGHALKTRLIDAVEVPIDGSSQARIKRIEAGGAELLMEIENIAPSAIMLIRTITRLYIKLKDAHLPVVNLEPLPFPSSGRQKAFHQKFRRFLNAYLDLR